jgi:hypothetical protein
VLSSTTSSGHCQQLLLASHRPSWLFADHATAGAARLQHHVCASDSVLHKCAHPLTVSQCPTSSSSSSIVCSVSVVMPASVSTRGALAKLCRCYNAASWLSAQPSLLHQLRTGLYTDRSLLDCRELGSEVQHTATWLPLATACICCCLQVGCFPHAACLRCCG